ncbi:MAG: PFL family protein [Candidatus Altiarchaeota archaeon]
MSISTEEVFETVSMTLQHNLDIRTVTLGINLKDCFDSEPERFQRKVYEKIKNNAQKLVSQAKKIEEKYGIPIVNKRISVTPVSILLESFENEDIFVNTAKTLDKAAKDSEIDFIGGFGAQVEKGMTKADERLIESLPQVFAETERVCGFVNVASTKAGIDVDAINMIGKTIIEIAKKTKDGIGCTKFVVFANAPQDNPFMAGAFHGIGEPDFSLNIGVSGPGVVRAVVEKNPNCDLTELSEVVKRTTFKVTRAGELIGRELAKNLGVPFGIVDISLAPTTKVGDSVAEIIEAMGVEQMGGHGSLAALMLLVDAVKKGGTMASGNVGGLSGTFIPVSEDSGMVKAVEDGTLTLAKLEGLTAVCSVGLDMIAIPGDTPSETISSIIADELAIGVVNDKTTGVRIIPIPGKKAGDTVDYGGLLGKAIVMEVSEKNAKKFLERGGRIPNTITSMRN